jgi:hypothetical protein
MVRWTRPWHKDLALSSRKIKNKRKYRHEENQKNLVVAVGDATAEAGNHNFIAFLASWRDLKADSYHIYSNNSPCGDIFQPTHLSGELFSIFFRIILTN